MSVYGPETPVPILQKEKEFVPLLDLYRARKPKRVLEVGTYHGGTLFHWLQNSTPGTLVVSVDSYAAGVDNRGLYDGWIPEGVDLQVIQGDSHDPAIASLVSRLGPYEWTFIDADHSYEGVKKDWDLYGPLTNGVVVFHDIFPEPEPNSEVKALWDQVKVGRKTEEFYSDPEHCWNGINLWGGIGVVYVGEDPRPDRPDPTGEP